MTLAKEQSANQVKCVGEPGEDFARSEGRAYFNGPDRIDSYQQLTQLYRDFSARAREQYDRRRVVFRVRCTDAVVTQLVAENRLPVEVILPLRLIDPATTDALITLGENVHTSEVREWPAVYQYWQRPNGNGRTPIEQIARHNPNRVRLTNDLVPADAETLHRIWQPFGWTLQGVEEFIRDYRTDGRFFSGVVDRQTNTLVSACMAEGITIAGIPLIEGTEYGTLPGQEGNGYCTAAVVGLHAQILQRMVYSAELQNSGETASETTQPERLHLPLILAEFNMTSRSDIVGRHTGMTVPLVEGTPGLESTPIQVLRHNVSVFDRHQPNTVTPDDLAEHAGRYREAFGRTYPYWRHFIVGMLPAEAIRNHYSREQVALMLSRLEQRSE